jgi:hypothetical protein
MKVVLMSGFSNVHLITARGWAFVQKPFKPANVKASIEEVI